MVETYLDSLNFIINFLQPVMVVVFFVSSTLLILLPIYLIVSTMFSKE